MSFNYKSQYYRGGENKNEAFFKRNQKCFLYLNFLKVGYPGPRSSEAALQSLNVGQLNWNKLGLIYYCLQGRKGVLLPGGEKP